MNNAENRKIKQGFPAVIAAAAIIIFLLMPDDAAQGCYDGVQLCINVAVPSLFPMMFAIVMAAETGVIIRLGRLCAPVTRWLFSLSNEAGGAVIAALVGGFPAGAKSVCSLYEQGIIDKSEAERMIQFCFASGPAFLVGAVGGIYGSSVIGYVLLVIQIISVALIGFISKLLFIGKNSRVYSEHKQKVRNTPSLSEAVTVSLSQTATVMLNICLFIVLFSIIGGVLEASGAAKEFSQLMEVIGFSESTAKAVLPVLIEVSSGCVKAADSGLPLVAFAIGFGGFAVHMQILAITKNIGISYWKFFTARLVQGLFSALMMWIYIIVFPGEAVTASVQLSGNAAMSGTPAGAVILVIMCIMWLMCIPVPAKRIGYVIGRRKRIINTPV